jgi:hypothetical protein
LLNQSATRHDRPDGPYGLWRRCRRERTAISPRVPRKVSRTVTALAPTLLPQSDNCAISSPILTQINHHRPVMAERRAAPLTFTAVARRGSEPRDLPARRELRLGDQEREELTEIATIASLEIAPVQAADG